jgi:hypothetical protein
MWHNMRRHTPKPRAATGAAVSAKVRRNQGQQWGGSLPVDALKQASSHSKANIFRAVALTHHCLKDIADGDRDAISHTKRMQEYNGTQTVKN